MQATCIVSLASATSNSSWIISSPFKCQLQFQKNNVCAGNYESLWSSSVRSWYNPTFLISQQTRYKLCGYPSHVQSFHQNVFAWSKWFFPFMRQVTDTSLYMKKFLNSCLISPTVLVNEYSSCSALLTDVTPHLNLENQSYVWIQLTASSLKTSFKISQI